MWKLSDEMGEDKFSTLARIILSQCVGRELSQEEFAKLDSRNLKEAIDGIHFLCGQYLNIAAIGSINKHTRLEQAQPIGENKNSHADIFYRILQKSLSIDVTDRGIKFREFKEQDTALAWKEELDQLDWRDLAKIHDVSTNKGIAEKFANGLLHGQEWLTDIDLSRLLLITGLHSRIKITHFDAKSLGAILHFYRMQRHDNEPYIIPLLLNKDRKGDVSNQGIHWVRTIVTVDPQHGTVSVIYKDSSRFNSSEQDRIEGILREAIHYDERLTGDVKGHHAFPGYRIESLSIESDENVQKQGWECGYLAFQRLIQDLGEINSQTQEIRDCENENKLREHIYSLLLREAKFPVSVLEKSSQGIFKRNTSSTSCEIDEAYLKDLISYISKVRPGPRSKQISPEELEIEKKADEHFKEYQSYCQANLVEDQVQIDQIDFEYIFKDSNDPIENKAKIRALVRAINEHHDKKIILNNIDQVKESEFFEQEFDRLVIREIQTNNPEHELSKFLKIVADRNELIAQLCIERHQEDDIWFQFWMKRLSNSLLYKDKLTSFRGDLALFTRSNDSNFNEIINFYVYALGSKYLQKLLDCLDSYRKLLESKNNPFPYSQLTINEIDYISDNNYALSLESCINDCKRQNKIPESLLDIIKKYTPRIHKSQLLRLSQEKRKEYLESLENIPAGPEIKSNLEEIKQLLRSKEQNKALDSNSTEYLKILKDHLQNGKYFPFPKINLQFYGITISDDDFGLLKEILLAAENYPSLEEISIDIGTNTTTFSYLMELQYIALREFFNEHKIKTVFKIKEDYRGQALSEEQKQSLEARELELYNQVATNRRNYNIEKRKRGQSAVKSDSMPSNVETVKRPTSSVTKVRPYKLNRSAWKQKLVTDVNIEQQHQHQLQTQIQQQTENQVGVNSHHEPAIEDFSAHGTNDQLSRNQYVEENSNPLFISINRNCAKFNLENSYILQKEIGEAFWNKAISSGDLPLSIKYITPEAAAKITNFPQYFLFGFNTDNLPEGFFICIEDESLILCYDESKYVENKNQSPLTIKLGRTKEDSYQRWIGDLRQFIPDTQADPDKIKSFDNILQNNKPDENNATIEKLYAFMEGLNQEAASFKEKHEWFFSNESTSKINILALIDVLYHEGCEGVDALLNTLSILYGNNPALYASFKRCFIDNNRFIMHLMSDANLEIIRKLASMRGAEQAWWMALTEQYMKYDTEADLAQLYAGFEYFLQMLPKGITLPIPCPIENCNNMLVGLDRVLAILGRVPPRNLPDQLEHLSGLSFDQEGAYYASHREEGFKFFHREMGLKPRLINRGFEESVLKRRRLTYKVTYTELKNVANSDDIITANFEISVANTDAKFRQCEMELSKDPAKIFVFRDKNAWYLVAYNNEGKMIKESLGQPEILSWLESIKDFKSISNEQKFELANLLSYLGRNCLDYPVMLFHRFLGGADRISDNYQKYVDLTDYLKALPVENNIKTKLLAVLAFATTGQRGYNFDLEKVQELFAFIGTSDPDKLNTVLGAVVNQLDQWQTKPKVDEITGLIKLLVESNQEPNTVLAILADNQSEKTLQALNLWHLNSQHLPADDFLTLYNRFKNFDKDNIGWLAKITALIKAPYDNVDRLIQALHAIKGQNEAIYKEALKILSCIDLDKTNHEDLPILVDLQKVFNALNLICLQDEGVNAVFPNIAQNLSNRHCGLVTFDMTQNFERLPIDLDAAQSNKLYEVTDRLNKKLESVGLKIRIDPDKLKGEDAVEYLRQWCIDLEKEVNTMGLEVRSAWALKYKPEVYKEIIEAIGEVLYVNLRLTVTRYPELSMLQSSAPFNEEPKLNGEFQEAHEDFATLREHSAKINSVFSDLATLYAKWPNDFSVRLFMSSNRLSQFNSSQLKAIFQVLGELETSFVPKALFDKIFAQVPFAQDVNLEDLKENIVYFIGLKDFTIKQRADLIELSISRPDIARRLVPSLRTIKEQHPIVLKGAFSLFTEHFKPQDADLAFIDKTLALLGVLGDNNDIKEIIFTQLANDLDAYNKLLNQFDKLKNASVEDKRNFLKVVAYSCLEDYSPENKVAIFGSKDIGGIVVKLIDFVKKPECNIQDLTFLYQKRPYPKSKSLEKFLNLLTPEARAHFQRTYECDPPGQRPEELSTQFNTDVVVDRIDTITDLSREKPLFYSQRETLQNYFLYVNAVGHSHPLSVPGLDDKQYRRPAKDLTKQQIQELIQYYRDIISGAKRATPQQIQVAKLEFVALAREAMYRTTGKMAYSTQVISLLNVMLHGGNIFSEIRTGEGKGLITCLFAASKWMEGGAVDVCSSNMELARRDLAEHSDFYEYLGIETALIKVQSRPQDYQQDGINYSDVSEMALFQEKMELLQKTLPKKVSCILDEADFNVLDNTTQFRYATSLDPTANPYDNPNKWVYPIILEFVERPKFMELCSKEDDIQHLKDFVRDHTGLSKAQKSQFTYFSDVQLDRWIDSAYIASKLDEGEDFVIRDITVIREEQEIPVRVARVKINHRESQDSTFSNGVQQFLHARLNRDKKGPCLIDPQTTYIAAKSAKNFVDYYLARGNVLGLTGTVGSKQERLEMRNNYGFKFYSIPPHKKLKRLDHAPIVASTGRFFKTTNETKQKQAHFEAILQQLKKCQQRGQPVLVICDGVNSSQELHHFLEGKLPRDKLQLYNGEQRDKQEKDVVTDAGKSGMITISTPMLGRGTDIKPDSLHGLGVIDTYIAAERDYGQKAGRAGRNGAFGDTYLIISEAEFRRYGRTIPKKGDLKRNIKEIRLELERKKAEERTERQYFADVKDQFYNTYIANCRSVKSTIKTTLKEELRASYKPTWKLVEHHCHLLWEQFLNSIDDEWNELLVVLHNELKANPELDKVEQLNEKIEELTKFANKEWVNIIEQINSKANGIFQDRLDKYHARKEEKGKEKTDSGNKPESKNPEINIPEIEFRGFSAKRTKEKPSTQHGEIPQLISSIRLVPETNMDKIYLDISGNQDVRERALTREINIVYEKLFGQQPPEDQTNPQKVKNILTRILDRYYATLTRPYDYGICNSKVRQLHMQLMEAIGKYGDDGIKNTAYDVHKTHIQQHQDNGRYAQSLVATMYKMRDRGMISNIAAIFDHDEQQIWPSLYEYATQQLAAYNRTWFKSADRKRALRGLQSGLSNINSQKDKPVFEKLQALIILLNNISYEAAKTDSVENEKISKWSPFAYRNTKGSRFQDTIDAIRSRALAYMASNPEPQLNITAEINHLRNLFEDLKKQANLSKVCKNIIINDLANDAFLSRYQSSANAKFVDLEVASLLLQEYKNLKLIQERLGYYRNKLAEQELDNDSQQAFRQLLDRVYNKFNQFNLTLQCSKKRDVISNHTNNLRNLIQSALQKLIKHNQVAELQIDLSKYEALLEADRNRILLASSLFEIERCIKQVFPNVGQISFVQPDYQAESGQFAIRLRFNEQPMNLTIANLKQGSEYITCYWPEFELVEPEFESITKAAELGHKTAEVLTSETEKAEQAQRLLYNKISNTLSQIGYMPPSYEQYKRALPGGAQLPPLFPQKGDSDLAITEEQFNITMEHLNKSFQHEILTFEQFNSLKKTQSEALNHSFKSEFGVK